METGGKRRYYVGPPENFLGNNFDQRLRSVYAAKLKETTENPDEDAMMMMCGAVRIAQARATAGASKCDAVPGLERTRRGIS